MSKNIGADCCIRRKRPQMVFMNSRLLDLFTLSVTLRCLIKTEERIFFASLPDEEQIFVLARHLSTVEYKTWLDTITLNISKGREAVRERV